MTQFSYCNEGKSMIVLRCIGPQNFFLERVIFPKEVFLFLAPQESKVEIWGDELYGPKLEQRLRIDTLNKDLPIAA
ncbi:DUF1830 domain-containing protein [Prochlorococcus marinus]|uniref:DUF1830 domain-containing protein n=1 Tax=Prochlorococcus marinus TaxID=1219 RepID=UPI0022B4F823|nr:DUF1830 domain-containing protein [Prochlorococcus marinus]